MSCFGIQRKQSNFVSIPAPAAVSDTVGQLSFKYPENASIFGHVAPKAEGYDDGGRYSNANSFLVRSVRISEYCKGNSIKEIDFLKIELAALRGMEPLLSERRVKAIYIETIKEAHDRMGTRFSELLSFISDCGYQFYIPSKNGEPESPVAIDQIKAHNHFFLPCRAFSGILT